MRFNFSFSNEETSFELDLNLIFSSTNALACPFKLGQLADCVNSSSALFGGNISKWY